MTDMRGAGSCTRHDVGCIYDRMGSEDFSKLAIADGGGLPMRRGSPYTGKATITLDPFLASESRRRRYLELQLLHTWTVDVCPTLPGSYEAQNLRTWTSDIPRLALDYEPLLTAVFSLCLLYLASVSSHHPLSEDERLASRAKYFEATLQRHRKALSAVDPQFADAISFTSIILGFDAFASLKDRVPASQAPYQPPPSGCKCVGV